MQKKYQIFVSSTFRDLADERQDAIRSILDLGHIPAGMELFPAADTEQLSYIKKVIDECDYYVLIIGGRYGSLDDEGVSFTEREYDYAVETGKVVIAFVHGDAASIPVGKSDTAPRLVAALNEFREKVMNGRLVRQWSTREQLEAMLIKAIVHAVANHPATGWIRGDAAANDDLLRQLVAAQSELKDVRAENVRLRSAASPSFSDLASMDDEVSLRFKYRWRYHQEWRDAYDNHSFTWREVFKAIGIRITAPTSSYGVSTALAEHLKVARGSSKSYTLVEEDRAVVKTQLSALKLLSVYLAKTLKDGSLHEFMQLTDRGKAVLAEMLAVRRSTDEDASTA